MTMAKAFAGVIEGTREEVRTAIEEEIAEAAEIGHIKSEAIPAGKGKHVEYRVECSCGWKSNPTHRKVTLLVMFYSHASEVVQGVAVFKVGKKRRVVAIEKKEVNEVEKSLDRSIVGLVEYNDGEISVDDVIVVGKITAESWLEVVERGLLDELLEATKKGAVAVDGFFTNHGIEAYVHATDLRDGAVLDHSVKF